MLSAVRPRVQHVVRRSRREARDVVLRHGAEDGKLVREDLATRYLRGDGIEIGALDFPLRVPRGARARYVDRLDEAGLRAEHADALRRDRPLVVPDVVDDGARLAAFPDGTLDFVVANHVLELIAKHQRMEDPIAAVGHQPPGRSTLQASVDEFLAVLRRR